MKITIHRGIDQIGGCITEIQSGEDRIIIDLGSNLPGTDGKDFSSDTIKSITHGAKAILYSHYHGDHVGHFPDVGDVPQFIGGGALEVMKVKYEALKSTAIARLVKMNTFRARQKMEFGNLKVTPFFCSHSAFDSYMFLIEDGHNKVLHTGDFRTHGYLGKGLGKVIPAFVGQVDVLITEGTMLCRANETVKSENDLQQEAYELLSRKTGSHHFFALCSSTDIDRLATLHAACKRAGAWLVVDSYQKEVLDVFTKYAGQYADLFVFDKLKVLGTGDFRAEITKDGFIMPIRSSQFDRMQTMRNKHANDAELIYSMWNGYLTGTEKQVNPDIKKIVDAFNGDQVHHLHTSGHATVGAIRDLIEMTKPRKKIVIIHKDKNSDIGLLNLSAEDSAKVVAGFKEGEENCVEV